MKKFILGLCLIISSTLSAKIVLEKPRFENEMLLLRWQEQESAKTYKRFYVCISPFQGQSDCLNAPADKNFYSVVLDPRKSQRRHRNWQYSFIDEFYPQDRQFMRLYRGQKVRIIVWACTQNTGCEKSNSKIFKVPYLKGTFEADLAPTMLNSKCLNCHGMPKKNMNWHRHVRENRFAPDADVFTPSTCVGCHNPATPRPVGPFPERWHAPHPSAVAFHGKISENKLCEDLKRMGQRSLNEHLRKDHLVVWALEKIGVSKRHWDQKVLKHIPGNPRDMNCTPPGSMQRRITRNYQTGVKRCHSHLGTDRCVQYPQ